MGRPDALAHQDQGQSPATLSTFETLFQRVSGPPLPLPTAVASLYGALALPAHTGRSYVIGQFDTALDGTLLSVWNCPPEGGAEARPGRGAVRRADQRQAGTEYLVLALRFPGLTQLRQLWHVFAVHATNGRAAPG
jgi:hypothetical protein